MAGDWIKMRIGLANDPAVISIAAGLDIGEFEVVGMLHHLWSWADTQSQDGHVVGVTRKWVDRFVHRDGFADRMQSAGWLIIDDSGIKFPNFDRHNGDSSKNRALATERKRKQRENVTPESQKMSRNERDEIVTREEKRREDKDQKHLSPEGNESATKKITYTEIQSAYNEICPPIFPACAVMNDKRKRQIKLMGEIEFLDVKPFTKGIEVWRQYFTDCLTNPHWCGQNDRNWRADFDFVTTPKNAIKLMELMN